MKIQNNTGLAKNLIMKSSGYGFVKCQKNNIVLVSEHNAPEDFKCIWTQSILRTIDNNKRVQSVEKLFKLN